MGYDEPPTRRMTPETPLRPLVPRGPVPPSPSGDDPPPSDREQLRELDEEVRTARTTLNVVAIVAALALIVACWAVIDGGDQASAPVSSGDGSGLESRVEAVERRVEARATSGDLKKLTAEVEQLRNLIPDDQTADGASTGSTNGDGAAADGATADPTATRELESLRRELQDLQDRIRRLESADGGYTPEEDLTTP